MLHATYPRFPILKIVVNFVLHHRKRFRKTDTKNVMRQNLVFYIPQSRRTIIFPQVCARMVTSNYRDFSRATWQRDIGPLSLAIL